MSQEQGEQKTEDEEELHLWLAFQQYMRGQISIAELEAVQHPHNQNVRKAIVTLAGHDIKRRLLIALHLSKRWVPDVEVQDKQQTADEKERFQWIAFRRYMRGQISIAELEAVQHPHNQNVHKAIITLAKQGIKRRLLNALHLR